MEENKETAVATVKHKLPTLADLTNDLELSKKMDELNFLLSQPPPQEWVRKHPTAKKKIIDEQGNERSVPTEFIPIEKVELLLTMIYQDWDVEVLREGALFNSVYCAVRVHYRHPITGTMRYVDGVGAVAVQTDGGKAASDLAAIKSNAIQIGLPAAKTYAQKDAVESLGRIFGKDLNRRDVADFTMAYAQKEKTEEEMLTVSFEEIAGADVPQELIDKVKVSTIAGLGTIWKENTEYQQYPGFAEICKKRRADVEFEILQAKNNPQL